MDLQKDKLKRVVGRGISKSFNAIPVLENCNFSIATGEITTIIGRSGCGKTTLLKCILGIEHVESGELYIEKKDGRLASGSKSYKSMFGLVLQGGFLWRRKTVFDNIITAPLLLKKYPKAKAVEKAMALLTRLGIDNKRDCYPEDISGGEQQRAAIARALIMEPAILLLDEITFSLDPLNKMELFQVIIDLKKDGYTIVLVSHDIPFSKKISDTILYMENGKIPVEIPSENYGKREGQGYEFLSLDL